MTTTELKEPPTPAPTQNEDSSTSKNVNLKKLSRAENVQQQDRDKESFYKDLQNFHENRNTPITRFPKIDGKEVDLHKLYSEVISRGGWLKVNIRNEWEDMISVLGFSLKCVNASVAIKQIYARFLDKYEKLNFLGEDPDRNDDIDDDGRHKKWSSKHCMQTIPMTYNYNQHNVSEQTRIQHKLSTDLYKHSEYEKLLLSLMSPLPNEQDFAINVCTLMANESKHTLKIENCPKLLDCLVGHAGVYCHISMRNLFEEFYTNIRHHSLQSFWNDSLQKNTQILELSYDDCLQASEEPNNLEQIRHRLRQQNQHKPPLVENNNSNELFATEEDIDYNKLEFLALGRRLGTHEYIGQRIQQIASIIRNLSFFEENVLVLAKNRTFIRFLIMCSNVRWGNIHHMALDVCGNIATEIELLDPSTDELTRCLLSTICDGLEGQDRGVIISSLEILNKLSQRDTHDDYLHKCLDQKIYNQICLYLSLNDIMLLLYTLECIYALSSLGARSCNSLIQVRGIIDTLVSLITVEAQSYGPDGCILMRVVETVPGNMLPMVAKNIANLQNVAMHGQVNVQHLQQQQIQSQGTTIIQQNQSAVNRLPAQINTQITATGAQVNPSVQQTTIQTPIKTVQSLQENEQFAISWLTATFEVAPSATSRVEQQELYKMYLSAIQKTGRRGSVTQSHFPRIVRSIFGTNIGPTMLKVIDSNGVESNGFFYICIRVRANPLPLKGTIAIQQQQQQQQQSVVVKTPMKSQIQHQQQQQLSIQQQINNDLVNKQLNKSEVGSKQQQQPQTKVINTKTTVATVVPSLQSNLTTNSTIASLIISQGQQQNEQNNMQNQEIDSNSNNIVSINNKNINNNSITVQQNRPQQSQQNIVLPNNNNNNNVALTNRGLTKTPIVKSVVVQQPQQISISNLIIQGQNPGQNVKIPISQTATSGTISGQIGTSPSMGGQQNPTSLIKSLLANKVTTTSANNNINTSATETIIASAASNNQSGLISQNVNVQLAQRQNLAKQKEVSVQQQQQQQFIQAQQQNHTQTHVVQTPIKLATTTISALVNNPIIQTTPVKVGQTTIKPINPNTIEKKTSIVPSESMDTSSNWDPVPPLAPLSGNTIRSTIMISSGGSIGQNSEDSNSTGNNSIASSSAISSSQIPINDDGENSVISFEGLLIPKSKSASSSTIDDENSNNSLQRSSSQVISANQMLVDLLDKKSPDPPLHGIKRKLVEDTIIVSCGNDKKKIAIGDSSATIPAKNAANLYAEMAASILEDEYLEDAPITTSQTKLQQTSVIQKPIDNQQKQIISVPLQRQIIMGPNSQQMIIQQNPTVSGNIVTTNTPHQATATIKTDSGLQTIPVILQKQIGPNGQQIIQPVIQHQAITQTQQQPTQTQYVLATNPQGQTYLVQTPAQPQTSQQQQQPQTLVLTQTGQQQGGTPTKTIIILQQQGGPPQAVAQQQIISAPGQPQKMIMTTPQGQQMIVTTQIPRPVQHHQIIMNPSTSVLQTTTGNNNGGNGNLQHQNVVITQSGVFTHHQQQQIQKQIQIHQQQQQQQQQSQLQIQQTITPQQLSAFQQQQASILSQLPQIPATIKLHSHQPVSLPSVIQQTQTTQTQTIKMLPNQKQPATVSIIAQTPSQPPVAPQQQQQIQIQGPITKQITKTSSLVPERKQIIVSGNEIIKQQTQQHQIQKQIQMATQQKQQQKMIQIQQTQIQQVAQTQQQIQQVVQLQQQTQQVTQSQTQVQGVQPQINLVQQQPLQQNQIHQQQQNSNQSQQQQIQVQQTSQHKSVIQQQIQQPIQQIQNQTANPGIQQQQKIVGTSRTPTPTNILHNSGGVPTPPPPSITSNIVTGRQLSTPTPPIPTLNQTPPPPKSPALPKPKTDEELIELNWVWICDWRGCPRRKFKSLQEVYRHACQVHCPDNLDPGAEIFCQWGPGQSLCDNIPRKRFSLMTHLLDRHCTIESLKAAVQRRLVSGLPPTPGPNQPVTIIKNTTEIRGTTASPTLSTSSSSSVPSAASAAMHAIKRHSNDFLNPKELMDENEGPVTKSIRLTAALILRNLVMYTANAKKNVRFYEPHLAGVALSNVESSRTISQILYELNN